ncbi:MAG: stalk domain-containing protein [Eubacteriales bacterium]
MKKLVFICTICMFLVMLAVPAYASQTVKVLIDDEKITFDVNPVIREGRTLVPTRKIVESIGGDVAWNPNNQTVTITKDKTTIILVINSKIAKVNDQDIELEVPAVEINGRVMVPARFIGENLNAEVKWDPSTWTVILNSPKNIDEEAFALLLKAQEKSADYKKFKADFNGNFSVKGNVPEMNQNLEFGLVGNLKADIEIPAFSFNGKVTLDKQEYKLEGVFIDNTIYFMDPITGKWQKEILPEESTQIFDLAMKQSVANQVYYLEFITKGKNAGLFRNVSFTGEKTINGIDTKGVYMEINGLKMGGFVKDMLSNLDTGFGTDFGTGEELDKEEFNKAIDEAFSFLTMDKLKYTLWIGKSDNIAYGYDGEFRYHISDLTGAEKAPIPQNMTFELNFNMTVSDINKPQGIVAPTIVEDTGGNVPGLQDKL